MTLALATLAGTGLITGKPVEVHLRPMPAGTGIVFDVAGTRIPAQPSYVINTDRGVTLAAEGKTLSLVEHFLSACAMVGATDLCLRVSGAPELPILDGSALPWVQFLQAHVPVNSVAFESEILDLQAPVVYSDPGDPQIHLTAFPADRLEITYLVDFDHPDLRRRWWTWQESQGSLIAAIAPARTFGFVSELPALQARGLALGVSLDNTLGLTETGDCTTPLRMPDEPIRHKILDLIGDLMLCGIPIHRLKARLVVFCAGHGSHLAFGQQLRQVLMPIEKLGSV